MHESTNAELVDSFIHWLVWLADRSCIFYQNIKSELQSRLAHLDSYKCVNKVHFASPYTIPTVFRGTILAVSLLTIRTTPAFPVILQTKHFESAVLMGHLLSAFFHRFCHVAPVDLLAEVCHHVRQRAPLAVFIATQRYKTIPVWGYDGTCINAIHINNYYLCNCLCETEAGRKKNEGKRMMEKYASWPIQWHLAKDITSI